MDPCNQVEELRTALHCSLIYLNEYADGFGVFMGIVSMSGAVVVYFLKHKSDRKAAQTALKQEEKHKEEIQSSIKTVEEAIAKLSSSIYQETKEAILDIFQKIVGELTQEIALLKGLLEEAKYDANRLMREIEIEKGKSPQFTSKIDRLEADYSELISSEAEAEARLAQLEKDVLAAQNICSDLLSGRWEDSTVSAQYERLSKLLARIRGGPVTKAAELAAKKARLQEGKEAQNLKARLNQREEDKESSQLAERAVETSLEQSDKLNSRRQKK